MESIDGTHKVNVSTFNIFRDSLKNTADELTSKLLASLPDINNDSDVSDSDEGEVVPMDYRTAMINHGADIVIQAKPLHFKQPALDEERKDLDTGNDDEYFDALRKEAFDEGDEQVQMLDPGLDI